MAVPQSRADDQTVDAFRAPKRLLEEAKRRAVELRMTKSGFYRYCLAKLLGYPEDEARAMAEHGAITNALAAMKDAAGPLPAPVKPEPGVAYGPRKKKRKSQ